MTAPDISTGMIYACALVITAILQMYIHHALYYYSMTAGWMARMSCIGLVHRKLMRTHGSSLGKETGGKIVNLVDSSNFYSYYFHVIAFGFSRK